jgi:hypothetical protein
MKMQQTCQVRRAEEHCTAYPKHYVGGAWCTYVEWSFQTLQTKNRHPLFQSLIRGRRLCIHSTRAERHSPFPSAIHVLA